MPQSLTVNLVLAKMAHGAGDKEVERPDRIITYKGDPIRAGLLNPIQN
jgi:hypothetical protein